MKIKSSELTGSALDWAVAKCHFIKGTATSLIKSEVRPYSTDWAYGGLIIEREELSRLRCYNTNEWECLNGDVVCEGATPLIAAMRCYVASNLGDEVEVPDELKGA